jgi:hypothetical protein
VAPAQLSALLTPSPRAGRHPGAAAGRDADGQGQPLVAFTQAAPATVGDARVEPHWGELTLILTDVEIRAAVSVPVEANGGPLGTLDIYAAEPRDWDPSELSAVQAYAGILANLLVSAVAADANGRLARQSQVALEHRVLIEQAKGVLMERDGLDARAAFERIRASARSSRRTAAEIARELPATVNRQTRMSSPRPDQRTGSGQLDARLGWWRSASSRGQGCLHSSGWPACRPAYGYRLARTLDSPPSAHRAAAAAPLPILGPHWSVPSVERRVSSRIERPTAVTPVRRSAASRPCDAGQAGRGPVVLTGSAIRHTAAPVLPVSHGHVPVL